VVDDDLLHVLLGLAVLMWERLSRCGTRMSATMVMDWMVEAGRGGGRPGWSA
jgi:hypothetical protein